METDKNLAALQEAADSVNASSMSDLISDIRVERIFHYLRTEPFAEAQRNLDRSFRRNLSSFTFSLALLLAAVIIWINYEISILLGVIMVASGALSLLYSIGIVQNFKEIKQTRASICAEKTHVLAADIRNSKDVKSLGELLETRSNLDNKRSITNENSE